MLKEFIGVLGGVVTCNTFPNMRLVNEDGAPLIDVSDGIGGMSGTALRPIAYSEAFLLRQMLPPSIPVTSVGGISTGKNIMERLALGCCGVQIGTAFFDGERRSVFTDMVMQFVDLPGAERYLSTTETDAATA